MTCGKLIRTLTVALALAAIALGGCGDGDGGTIPTSADPTATQDNGTAPQTPPQDAGSPSEEASRGGEASIEDFGSEAEGSEREAILAAFNSYLDAITAEDYVAACADLSTGVHESLTRLAGRGSKQADCTTILPVLLSPAASRIAREQAGGRITKVRVDDEQAFVVFEAPGAELYQLSMIAQDGEWKATTVVAGVLVPSL